MAFRQNLSYISLFLLIGAVVAGFAIHKKTLPKHMDTPDKSPFIIVLGTAQDGGFPHAACHKACCAKYYSGAEQRHYVSCLALVDPVSHQRWLFDCTPDFTMQLHALDSVYPTEGLGISGIFLTHAHIGHYTGLMYLGREAINSRSIPVYAMPRMRDFLTNNAPWGQLVKMKNIALQDLAKDSSIQLNERVSVTPFRVPHRDEYSETVGYRITAQGRHVIFIPDIDKWEKWDGDLAQTVRENDLVFIDGTFFKDGELPGIRMKDIPHPFIEETMRLLEHLPEQEKQKVHFIHLNHTNPALTREPAAINEIESLHFRVAKEMQVFVL
jgi:pyrroloquinoline quinone biosynthesis protein B